MRVINCTNQLREALGKAHELLRVHTVVRCKAAIEGFPSPNSTEPCMLGNPTRVQLFLVVDGMALALVFGEVPVHARLRAVGR